MDNEWDKKILYIIISINIIVLAIGYFTGWQDRESHFERMLNCKIEDVDK